ncbi:Sodium/calcium exchanger protein [uncultured archaeon]|nr:Sodium/calcium exchanger protein [uncultured archaeon]
MPHRVNRIFLALLLFIPLSWYFAFTGNSMLTFITSILAIIPLARIIGHATKEIALQANPTFGGLINATFGNVIELMIAFLALSKGLIDLVEASIIGSIIGNILLLIGLSLFVGGLKHKEQKFNQNSVGVSSTMLIIAIAGLAIPTAFSLTGHATGAQIQIISEIVAVVLALTYIAGLIFSFKTHKHLFDASDDIKAAKEKPTISMQKAALILLIATIAVAFESEFLVSQVEQIALSIGITQMFIGVVIIAIVTNIAEKANSVHFAIQNKIDLSIEIGLSSAIQIALFVVPVLVLVSHFLNYQFTLIFSVFEIIAMFLAVMIVNYLSADGKCNWLEGIQLIAVYLIIITAFYFI